MFSPGIRCHPSGRQFPVWAFLLRIQSSPLTRWAVVSAVGEANGPHDADSNRANLAPEFPACRTPKRGLNAAQGDFSDAPHLCLRCPVGGLNAKACHDRRQVTGKVCRLDFYREFAFRLRLLQTLLQSRFTAFSPIDH